VVLGDGDIYDHMQIYQKATVEWVVLLCKRVVEAL